MRPIPVGELEEGMKVGKTIYTAAGNVLLSAGMYLKENYIDRLRELNIVDVYIVDENLPQVEVPEPISDKTRLNAIKVVKGTMEDIESGNGVNFDRVKDAVDSILDEVLLQNHVVLHLNDIRSYDSYTFHHSVGVTILSVLIALQFDYNREQLQKIAIGAFLHDVGKTEVHKDIIMKPGKLTDEEFKEVKAHSRFGYDVMREVTEISIISAHIAYQHHEKLDGSGYPRGLKGEQIHDFAQIVSVADIYDALTSDRVYKRKLMPHEAVKIIKSLEGKKLNSKYINALFKHIATYPMGSIVKLSNNETGMVVDVNKENLSAPIIRIIKDENGQEIEEIREVDLIHTDNLHIEEVL